MGVWYNTRHLLGIDVADATIEKQASGLESRQVSFANVHLGRVASCSAEIRGTPERADMAGSIPYCLRGSLGRVTASMASSSGDEDAVRWPKG